MNLHVTQTTSQQRAPALETLRREFPGLLTWYGLYTGTWWAFLPIGAWGRLVEAATPEDLATEIIRWQMWRADGLASGRRT